MKHRWKGSPELRPVSVVCTVDKDMGRSCKWLFRHLLPKIPQDPSCPMLLLSPLAWRTTMTVTFCIWKCALKCLPRCWALDRSSACIIYCCTCHFSDDDHMITKLTTFKIYTVPHHHHHPKKNQDYVYFGSWGISINYWRKSTNLLAK